MSGLTVGVPIARAASHPGEIHRDPYRPPSSEAESNVGQSALLDVVEQDRMEPPQEISAEQIRERAYDLWDRNHRPSGFDIEFWLMAERELKTEHSRSQIPGSADESRSPSPDPEVQGQEPGSAQEASVVTRSKPAF